MRPPAGRGTVRRPSDRRLSLINDPSKPVDPSPSGTITPPLWQAPPPAPAWSPDAQRQNDGQTWLLVGAIVGAAMLALSVVSFAVFALVFVQFSSRVPMSDLFGFFPWVFMVLIGAQFVFMVVGDVLAFLAYGACRRGEHGRAWTLGLTGGILLVLGNWLAAVPTIVGAVMVRPRAPAAATPMTS